MSFALPRPEASTKLVSQPAPTLSSPAQPAVPRRSYKAVAKPVSPFLPKQKSIGKLNDNLARLSDAELTSNIDRLSAALTRAGTSTASTVLERRLDAYTLERTTRQLRRSSLNGASEEGETPETMRRRIERLELKDELSSPASSARTRLAEGLVPNHTHRSRIEPLEWAEGERLLRAEWERDKQARETLEAQEAQRSKARPLRTQYADEKQDALRSFAFGDAMDDDDYDSEESEREPDEGASRML